MAAAASVPNGGFQTCPASAPPRPSTHARTSCRKASAPSATERFFACANARVFASLSALNWPGLVRLDVTGCRATRCTSRVGGNAYLGEAPFCCPGPRGAGQQGVCAHALRDLPNHLAASHQPVRWRQVSGAITSLSRICNRRITRDETPVHTYRQCLDTHSTAPLDTASCHAPCEAPGPVGGARYRPRPHRSTPAPAAAVRPADAPRRSA